MSFFIIPQPPIITGRSANVQLIAYGFADASGSGFGASISYENGTRFRDDTSSNFREFCNVVETLESEAKAGRLQHCTLILATDNSTVESAVYKGNSSSAKLFDLVLRLKLLEVKTGSKFIITHVSGNRMKHQGTDGISQ